MGFRNNGSSAGGGTGTIAPGTPTKSIEIGDLFEQGTTGNYADAGHQHAVPAPPAGYAQPLTATGSDSDATDTAPARSRHSHAHTRAMHLAGGHADLSGDFPTYTAGDARYAAALHGARHAPGGVDDLSPAFVPKSLLTASGDLLVRDSSGPVRLPAGPAGTFLGSDGSSPSWKSISAVAQYSDPQSFQVRKQLTPDGLDLAFYLGTDSGVVTAFDANSVTINAFHIYLSGLQYDFPTTTVTNSLTRPATGSTTHYLVAGIDNANGGPGTAQLYWKSSGAMTTQDLTSSSTAKWERVIYRATVTSAGIVFVDDARPIARGMSGTFGTSVKIGELVLGSAGALSIPNIPTGFRHLEFTGQVRCNAAAAGVALRIKLNNGGSYDSQSLAGDGTTAAASRGINESDGFLGYVLGTTSTEQSNWSSIEGRIFNYTDTTKRKTISARCSYDVGDTPITFQSNVTDNDLTRISRFDLLAAGGSSFLAGSVLSIYGVR